MEGPGGDQQDAASAAAGRNRRHDRRGQRLGEAGAEPARGIARRTDAGGGYREALSPGGPAAQAADGGGIPGCLYRRRSAALGGRRAPPPDATDPFGGRPQGLKTEKTCEFAELRP